MEIQQLKSLAKQRVSACRYDARKLALIFTGAGVALSLLMTLVNFFLSQQIEGTGGLGGIGTRTLLSSIQMLVMLGGALAMPFWSLGYTRAALDTGRDGSATPRTLLDGFRLFFPALRLFFLQGALLTVIVIASMQLGSILYMLTPVSEAAIPMIEGLLSEGEAALADPSAINQLLSVFWPMYLLMGIVLLVLLIPVLYRLRLVEFSLVDGEEKALKNMITSNLRMKGHCLWMFKLDVSFWWYFLLQGLAAVLAYGDSFFPGSDVAYWVFYLLSAAAQLIISFLFLPQVQTTYALAYDEITKDENNGQVL